THVPFLQISERNLCGKLSACKEQRASADISGRGTEEAGARRPDPLGSGLRVRHGVALSGAGQSCRGSGAPCISALLLSQQKAVRRGDRRSCRVFSSDVRACHAGSSDPCGRVLMEVIFIRHLPTPGNEKRQYIGSTDETLSEQAVKIFRGRQ